MPAYIAALMMLLESAIPIPAMAAGYTTLAFHSDFTQSFYADASNWLDCAGAANPQWWIGGVGGVSPPPLCERVSIVNDNGTQALDLKFTADDYASGSLALTTISPQFDRGVDFGNGFYAEVTARVTPESINNNNWGDWVAGFWTWSDTQALGISDSWLEFDVLERFANGGDGGWYDDSFVHVYPDPNYGGIYLDGWGNYYGVDPTQYHTIGMRVLQGTSDLQACMYVDNEQRRCGSLSGSGYTETVSQMMERNFGILAVGHSYQPVKAPMEMLVRDVEIWTCGTVARTPFAVPGNACSQ